MGGNKPTINKVDAFQGLNDFGDDSGKPTPREPAGAAGGANKFTVPQSDGDDFLSRLEKK